MINIRTITYNFPSIAGEELFSRTEKCAIAWGAAKYPVHTQRVDLPLQTARVDRAALEDLAAFCSQAGIRWFNVPFDPWVQGVLDPELIPSILGTYDGAFSNIICAKDQKVREDILSYAASTIRRVGELDSTGKDNFRLGTSMNVGPDGPFFPFTYSGSPALSFSIGLEIAEEINQIMRTGFSDLQELRGKLTAVLQPQFCELETIAEEIARETGVEYRGIDFSLAPLPENGHSVISILQGLGIRSINGVGMLFATAFLTDLLKGFASDHKSTGFSGVMYSLLEDGEYASLNDRQGISIDRMISLSTMCGCGVDMIPIDRNTELSVLRSILLEVACVSSRLQKPLGVRLLPVQAGNDGRTNIVDNEDFIINTRLVSLDTNELAPLGDTYSFFSRRMN